MSRTVSYGPGAVVVCYRDISDYDYPADIIGDIEEYCISEWKSLKRCEFMLSREDIAILQNTFCYIGVSEYCGLLSIWIVPKQDYDNPSRDNLALRWIDSIKPKFIKYFGELRKIATFSNGEAIYEPINKEVVQ